MSSARDRVPTTLAAILAATLAALVAAASGGGSTLAPGWALPAYALAALVALARTTTA